jgi:hypothetical protein
MANLYVRSITGESFEWREHGLAPLIEQANWPLRFEPRRLPPGEAPPGHTHIAPTATGFQWNSAGACLVAQGASGNAILGEIALQPAGESPWQQWLGCSYIDLTPKDASRTVVVGEVVRLRVPSLLPQVGVRHLNRMEIEIYSQSHALMGSQVQLYRRVQNGAWRLEHSLSTLGVTKRLKIPGKMQGAFAIVMPDGRLASAFFFTFEDWLLQPEEQEWRDLSGMFPSAQTAPGPLESWPAWVTTSLTLPIGAAGQIDLARENGPEPLESKLRRIERAVLLQPYGVYEQDWGLQVTLEEFIADRWPKLKGIVGRSRDPQLLSLTLQQRESPLLDQALQWANSNLEALGACMRLSAHRARVLQIETFLPADCQSRPLLDRLLQAMGGLPIDLSLEAVIGRLWGELDLELKKEFSVGLEAINPEVVDAARFWYALQAAGRQLGMVQTSGLSTLTAGLDALKADSVRELLLKCKDLELISAEMMASLMSLQTQILTSLQQAGGLAPASLRQVEAKAYQELVIASKDADLGLAAASRQKQDELRRNVVEAIKRKAERDQIPIPEWPARGSGDLVAVLTDALKQFRSIDDQAAARKANARELEYLRSKIPGVEPDSPEAEIQVRTETRSLLSRVEDLLKLEDCLDISSRLRLEAAAQTEDASSASPRSQGRAKLIAAVAKRDALGIAVSAAEQSLLRLLVDRAGSERMSDVLNRWLNRGEYANAQRLAVVAQQQTNTFSGRGRTPLGEILWLGTRPEHRELARLDQVLQAAEQATSLTELQTLEGAVQEAKVLVDALGGTAALRTGLLATRSERWGSFVHRFHVVDRDETPDALANVLKAAGASRFGFAGPLITVAPLKTGVAPETLRGWLNECQLWPGGREEKGMTANAAS